MPSHLTRFAFLPSFAHLTIELCANFLPVIYPILISTLGVTYTQVGVIALIGGAGATLTQPLFGYLSDRWSPHRITILSIAWIGLLMGLVGFTRNYPSLVLLVGMAMLGSAAFHPAGASLALAGAGDMRRGASASIFSVGGNLGAALSPLWVALGIGWLGLRGTVVIIPVALLVSLFLYQQLPQAAPVENRPPITAKESQSQQPLKRGPLLGLSLVILVVMCRSWFQLSLATYLPEWIQSQGQPLAVGSQMLSIFLISIGIGSLAGGSLSDYVGRWQVMALSLALLSPAQWLFLRTSGPLQIGFVGVMGTMIGASLPVGLVMAQEAWSARVGVATALVMGLGWAPGGIGASITGLIADHFSLTVGLQSLIVPPILGVMGALAYAALQRREQYVYQS